MCGSSCDSPPDPVGYSNQLAMPLQLPGTGWPFESQLVWMPFNSTKIELGMLKFTMIHFTEPITVFEKGMDHRLDISSTYDLSDWLYSSGLKISTVCSCLSPAAVDFSQAQHTLFCMSCHFHTGLTMLQHVSKKCHIVYLSTQQNCQWQTCVWFLITLHHSCRKPSLVLGRKSSLPLITDASVFHPEMWTEFDSMTSISWLFLAKAVLGRSVTSQVFLHHY